MGNVEKSYVAVMVTGMSVEADADGAEPIVKKPAIHSTIAAKQILLCRVINFRFFIFNFPFVVLAFFDFPSWEVSSGRSLMYCAKIGWLLRGKLE
jgi:hypothetical protein